MKRLLMILICGCMLGCCPKGLNEAQQNYRRCSVPKLTVKLSEDIPMAVRDPEFLPDRTYQVKWHKRTGAWEVAIGVLADKASEEMNPDLIDAAVALRETVRQLRSEEELRRKIVQDGTLITEMETLDRASSGGG